MWVSTGVALLLVATTVVWLRATGNEDQPLTVQARQTNGCPNGAWVFPAGLDPTTLPSPESMNATEAYRRGGATPSGKSVDLTVHGNSTQGAVVLQDLRVLVLSREPAPQQAMVVTTCFGAGSLSPRRFNIDLDNAHPIPVPRPGDERIPGDEMNPAPEFPYRVSATDPEVFTLFAQTEQCACRWQLELDWAAPEGSGTEIIDLSGQPFRTTADENWPRYKYFPSTDGNP